MRGLLFVAIDVPSSVADELNRWYDTEHVPERSRIPGFERITRWERVAGDLPEHVALFELSSPTVLESPAYAALKAGGDTAWTTRLRPRFQRTLRHTFSEVVDYGGTPGRTAACAVALTDVDEGDAADYRRWYDTEHGPAVAAVPGVVRVRRFEGDGAPRHLTVLELVGSEVLDGEAYAAAKRRAPGDALRARWRRSQGTYTVRDAYRNEAFQREV